MRRRKSELIGGDWNVGKMWMKKNINYVCDYKMRHHHEILSQCSAPNRCYGCSSLLQLYMVISSIPERIIMIVDSDSSD